MFEFILYVLVVMMALLMAYWIWTLISGALSGAFYTKRVVRRRKSRQRARRSVLIHRYRNPQSIL